MAKIPDDIISKTEELGDLREKELQVRKAEVQRKFDKLQGTAPLIDSIKNFDLDTHAAWSADRVKKAYQDIADDRRVLRESVVFINEGLTNCIPFSKGSMYLIGAVSGHGKSTAAANVSFPLWKQGKKTLVIANEERSHHVWARIACLDLGLDFNDWRNNKMPPAQRRSVDLLIPEVMKFVTVIGTDQKGLTTTLEGLKKVLEAAKDSSFSCILIDYFQNISALIDNPSLEHVHVLYAVRDYLNDYVTRAKMPVVLFCQLKPLPQGAQDRMFSTRIKWCTGIYEAATTAIEIVRISKDKKSFFLIDKDRFGMADTSIECKFSFGRYLFVNPIAEINDAVQEQQVSGEKLAPVLEMPLKVP